MDTYGSVVVESTDTESCSAIATSGNFVNKSVKIKPDLVCFGFGLFVFVVFVLFVLGVFLGGGGAKVINFSRKSQQICFIKYYFYAIHIHLLISHI